jgi:hypothetical protein
VGTATVVKALTIFLPPEVESIRAKLDARRPDAGVGARLLGPPSRGSGVPPRLGRRGRPEHPLRGRQAPPHPLHAPASALAQDLREWFLASGRPASATLVFPAHDGGFWSQDDWRNWRKRVWLGEPERHRSDRRCPTPPRIGCAPAGTRPRDLRSSFVTLRVYEGIPLTQIGREVVTSVRMIEEHYAGVIANWNQKRVSAERQIRAARRIGGPQMASEPNPKGATDAENAC